MGSGFQHQALCAQCEAQVEEQARRVDVDRGEPPFVDSDAYRPQPDRQPASPPRGLIALSPELHAERARRTESDRVAEQESDEHRDLAG